MAPSCSAAGGSWDCYAGARIGIQWERGCGLSRDLWESYPIGRAGVCSRASARGSWVTDLCIQTQTLNSEGKAGARAALKASAETCSRFYFLSFGLGKGNKALCGSQGRGSQTLPPLCVWKPFSGFPVRCELTLQGSLAEWGWAAGRMSPELEEPGEQRASTVFPC